MIDTFTEMMNEEEQRLQTFINYPDDGSQHPAVLALHGFVYCGGGVDDTVECTFCGQRKTTWRAEDDVVVVHREMSPCCPMLTALRCNNVPFSSQSEEIFENDVIKILDNVAIYPATRLRESDQQKANRFHSSQAAINPARDSRSQTFIEPSQHSDEQKVIVELEAVRSVQNCLNHFSSEVSRLRSFDNSCFQRKSQTPKDLAKAGFFYAGYSDHTRCFYCGIGLKKWQDGENVWIEHSRWSPTCQHVLKHLTQESIDAVQRIHLRNRESHLIITFTMVASEIREIRLQNSVDDGSGNSEIERTSMNRLGGQPNKRLTTASPFSHLTTSVPTGSDLTTPSTVIHSTAVSPVGNMAATSPGISSTLSEIVLVPHAPALVPHAPALVPHAPALVSHAPAGRVTTYTTVSGVTCSSTSSGITCDITSGITTTGAVNSNITTTGAVNSNNTTTGAVNSNITTTGAVNSNITTTGAVNSNITTTGAVNSNITTTGAVNSNITTTGAVNSNIATTGAVNSNITTTHAMTNGITTVPDVQISSTYNSDNFLRNSQSRLLITMTQPKYQRYTLNEQRTSTFINWPRTDIRPSILSSYGFFYTGRYIACFLCGCKPRCLESEERVQVEHALRLPDCPRLRLQMGQSYVDRVQSLAKTYDHDIITVVLSRDLRREGSQLNTYDRLRVDPAVRAARDLGHPIEYVLEIAQLLRMEGESLSGPTLLDRIYRERNVSRMATVSSCQDRRNWETTIPLVSRNAQLRRCHQCKICLVHEVAAIFLPCGHLVACEVCATELGNICPICRRPIEQLAPFYFRY